MTVGNRLVPEMASFGHAWLPESIGGSGTRFAKLVLDGLGSPRHAGDIVSSIWVDLFVLVYAVATGIVAAGIVSSFYQMVTTKPARFGLFGTSLPAWFLTFVFVALTGPFIILRNAIKGRLVERQPWLWLFTSIGIACLWSGCSGLIVLDVALSARNGLI